MHQSRYQAIAEDTTELARENERLAFTRSIALLRKAQAKGTESRECVDALFFVNRLWSLLLEDLADDDNGLPDALRSSLISIGIWVLRRAEEIRQGKSDDFSALIQVSESVSNGLGRI
ncbi:flagellar biosynthesis regulator FlaF [Aestuariivirga sp.]|uniref:flagellar biosynthesis regulator FlaF n=1 Tax=Aestuariivirga sp. TaxID=2650926 RepID=UPI0035939753